MLAPPGSASGGSRGARRGGRAPPRARGPGSVELVERVEGRGGARHLVLAAEQDAPGRVEVERVERHLVLACVQGLVFAAGRVERVERGLVRAAAVERVERHLVRAHVQGFVVEERDPGEVGAVALAGHHCLAGVVVEPIEGHRERVPAAIPSLIERHGRRYRAPPRETKLGPRARRGCRPCALAPMLDPGEVGQMGAAPCITLTLFFLRGQRKASASRNSPEVPRSTVLTRACSFTVNDGPRTSPER